MRKTVIMSVLCFLSITVTLLGFMSIAYGQEIVSYPDTKYTTGKMCSEQDTNFSHTYRYLEKIPYCSRNVKGNEKSVVSKEYGINRKDWKNYEFDHLFPLSMGGSDNIENIWPQPIEQAHAKDRIEDEVYIGMKKGTITQKEAIRDIVNWFCYPCSDLYGKDICKIRHINLVGLNMTNCTNLKLKLLPNH